jgi:hypothetical protein
MREKYKEKAEQVLTDWYENSHSDLGLTRIFAKYEQRVSEQDKELVALRARAEAAEGLRVALEQGIHTLEVAVESGLDGFTPAAVKEILTEHVVLKRLRAALDAYDKSREG